MSAIDASREETPANSARAAVAALAEECRQCYQCGQCTSACPSGWDLREGPRLVVHMVLSGHVAELLSCEDVWRCTECGTCTRNCPMEVDTMGVLAAIRRLQRERRGERCPERAAAEIADWWLGRAGSIDNIVFGAAMVSRGHLPRDPIGSAEQGGAAARSLLTRAAGRVVEMTGLDRRAPAAGRSAPARFGTPAAPSAGRPFPFFRGCSLPQDPSSAAAVRDAAAGLGLALDELRGAGCCGHPARGRRPADVRVEGPVLTVCPACDVSLREAGLEPRPLWEALLDRARTTGCGLRPAAPAFVPYVGCLVERAHGLEIMRRSAEAADCHQVLSYPSLHASCCGALGAVFRGESTGSRRLVDFASRRSAPIVTTCLLCRDNVRSAARRMGRSVEVHFWPEFFTAVPGAVEAAATSSTTTLETVHAGGDGAPAAVATHPGGPR